MQGGLVREMSLSCQLSGVMNWTLHWNDRKRELYQKELESFTDTFSDCTIKSSETLMPCFKLCHRDSSRKSIRSVIFTIICLLMWDLLKCNLPWLCDGSFSSYSTQIPDLKNRLQSWLQIEHHGARVNAILMVNHYQPKAGWTSAQQPSSQDHRKAVRHTHI